ncbi:hypothetical protein [Pendulispora albinea]|uniref:Uncharacterized protein n=1 Tax=Pendulispora albinea TaxID=2741071 RepID=A0ABZ2MBU3_9BACT
MVTSSKNVTFDVLAPGLAELAIPEGPSDFGVRSSGTSGATRGRSNWPKR